MNGGSRMRRDTPQRPGGGRPGGHTARLRKLLLALTVCGLLAGTASAVAVPMLGYHRLEITVRSGPAGYRLDLMPPEACPAGVYTAAELAAQCPEAAARCRDGTPWVEDLSPVIADPVGTAQPDGTRLHVYACYRSDFLPEHFRLFLAAPDGTCVVSRELRLSPLDLQVDFNAADGTVESRLPAGVLAQLPLCAGLTAVVGLVWYRIWRLPPGRRWVVLLGGAASLANAFCWWLGADIGERILLWPFLVLAEAVLAAVILHRQWGRAVGWTMTTALTSLLAGTLLQMG